jgi:hypothetical protein
MTMIRRETAVLTLAAGNLTAVSTADLSLASAKGYSLIRGAGAGWTGNIEGSVDQGNWTVIAAADASKQGSVADHYNFVRINVSVAGAVGTGTRFVVSGKRI